MARRKIEYKDIFRSKEMVEFYATHPIEFVDDIIFNKDAKVHGGTLELTWQQKEIILSVAKNKRTSVASGKGIGKTTVAACLIIWYLSIFRTPKIICSSPSKSQLYTALWPTISKWLKRSLVRGLFEMTATKLALRTDTVNWTCVPKTVSKGSEEAASGAHEENMLIICDEPAAMSDKVLDNYDTTLTEENNRLLLIGNPTRTDGFFYNTHNKYKKYWVTLQYNSEESDVCDKEEIRMLEERYGREHDIFQVSVLGNFPKGTSNSFLSLFEVEEAVSRDPELEGEIEIGVDVARYGDDLTVVCSRKGNAVFPFETRAKSSTPETAVMVLETVKSLRAKYNYKEKIRVKVDDSGIGGAVTDILMLDRENDIEVIPCNFGGKGNDTYFNEASIMWGNVKENIGKISLPRDKNLIEELSARRWALTDNGKIKIEPKREFKENYGSSPDRADALVLCFARKQSERVVLKDFDFLDPNVVKKLPGYITGEKYVSIFYSKNKVYSMVVSYWCGNRLYVVGDYESEDSIYNMANEIRQYGKIDRAIGNEVMFKKYGEDIRSQLNAVGILINDNYRYDEPGALENLKLLIKNKRINFDTRCQKTIDQFRRWSFDDARHKVEAEFGMCFAILNLVSELKEKIERIDRPQVIMPYTDTREKLIDNIKSPLKQKLNRWMYH